MRESGKLAEFISRTSYEALPANIAERAKNLTLDYLAAGFLGSHAEMSSVYRSLFGIGEVDGWLTLSGDDRPPVPAPVAAALNAAYGHQVELAEGVSRAIVHCSNAVVPAALAVGQREGSSGREIVRAIALGCEALIRWGYCLNSDPARPPAGDQAVAYRRGWWTPAALAPMGAATAAILLQGGKHEEILRSWSLAANACLTVTNRLVHDGGSGKGIMLGLACMNGILAADLAAKGVTGTNDIEASWLPLLNPNPDRLRLSDNLGSKYELDFVLYKYFATTGPLFSSLEAVFALLARDGAIDLDKIASIRIDGYRRVQEFYRGTPPENPEAARSDVAYCVARALVSGDPGDLLEDAFTEEAIRDPRTLGLASKVTVAIDDNYESLYPRQAAYSRLTITLQDGKTHQMEVDRDQIGRYHYPTRDETGSKFRAVASKILGLKGVDAVASSVWNLDTVDGARQLMSALKARPGT